MLRDRLEPTLLLMLDKLNGEGEALTKRNRLASCVNNDMDKPSKLILVEVVKERNA